MYVNQFLFNVFKELNFASLVFSFLNEDILLSASHSRWIRPKIKKASLKLRI